MALEARLWLCACLDNSLSILENFLTRGMVIIWGGIVTEPAVWDALSEKMRHGKLSTLLVETLRF